MNALRLIAIGAVLVGSAGFYIGTKQKESVAIPIVEKPIIRAPKGKIQAAILLDVSNSMDGLIDQAKAQLWNMVSVMGRATCEGEVPEIEIALYEYGRSSNDRANGYIKQLSPFTTDLDELSKQLFTLTTEGGDEYCNTVVLTTLKDLKWANTPNTYKVIFIAGNEDYNQGSDTWTAACAKAKEQGVIVNTIYCGTKQQGIREHWNLGTECGQGSFTNIDQDAKQVEIATPYDDVLFSYNQQLNGTYIGYGAMSSKVAGMQVLDEVVVVQSRSAAAKRIAVKADKNVYKNDAWDMVDAQEKNKDFYKEVKKEALPDSLKALQPEALKIFIEGKTKQRAIIQDSIGLLAKKRAEFITNAKKDNVKTATLESAIENIIKEQVTRFNMKIGE
jgi:hypothetical protein